MKLLIEKLAKLEQEVASEKGAVLLFALFLREDAPDIWDLLVSAPWVEDDKGAALKYLAGKLSAIATPEELLRISRMVVIEPSNPALAALQSTIHVEHGSAEVQNGHFFGLPIKHAYIITSQQARMPSVA